MFTAISSCIKQFFNAITLLFAAAEKISSTALILSTVGEDTALMYSDEARINRAKQLAKLNAELQVSEAAALTLAKSA